MISLINSLSGTYFLWDVPDLAFDIKDGERAKVACTCEDGEMYSEFLWPVGQRITLREITALIQGTVERKLRADFIITIHEMYGLSVLDSKTLTFTVIYANVETGVTPEEFERSYFLSTFMGERRTAMGRLEYLHYLGADEAVVVAYYADGTNKGFAPEVTSEGGSYRQIDVSPSNFTSEGRTLISYTVMAGTRRQEYTIDDWHHDAAPILLFRNSFGVDELAYCTGKHQVAPEYVRSSSVIDGRFRNYDIEERRWFNADTGFLTPEEAAWFDDVFRSKEVYVCNCIGGVVRPGKEIAITDSKSENDNNPDTMPRFTFKYRYAQRQHNILQLERVGRIFDNTFDSTFN